MVVFDAQAAGRAASRAIIRPERAETRVIGATYSLAAGRGATASRRTRLVRRSIIGAQGMGKTSPDADGTAVSGISGL